MKKQLKRILAIVLSLGLLTGLTAGISLVSHAEAGTENIPNEWEPHNYVADDGQGTQVVSTMTDNGDGSFTISGNQVNGNGQGIGVTNTVPIDLKQGRFSIDFSIDKYDVNSSDKWFGLFLSDKAAITNAANASPVYRHWDNAGAYDAAEGRGFFLMMRPEGDGVLQLDYYYMGVNSAGDWTVANNPYVGIGGGTYSKIRLNSGNYEDVRIEFIMRTNEPGWDIVFNKGAYSRVGDNRVDSRNEINPGHNIGQMYYLENGTTPKGIFESNSQAYAKLVAYNAGNTEMAFTVKAFNNDWTPIEAKVPTTEDWGLHNYVVGDGNMLYNSMQVTADGKVEVTGYQAAGFGECGITYLNPVNLHNGFEIEFSLDQYQIDGEYNEWDSVDSYIALQLSDKAAVSYPNNTKDVYTTMIPNGNQDPAYGAGFIMLMRPIGEGRLKIAEIFYKGVRFSGNNFEYVNCMDTNNGGCYAFIQLNDKDYQNIKLSLIPAGDGGLLIVFNDGQYVRVNNNGDINPNSTEPVSFSQGERIDSSNEMNPHNHFGDIMKFFTDDRPAYVKLVYHHGLRRGEPSKHNLDSATIKFTINSINGVQACKPAEVITVDDGIYEIFPDTKFEQGFRVSGLYSLQEATQQPYWFKYGNDELIPTWKICQWDSGEDLRDENLTMFMDLGDGQYVYENSSKTITVDTQEGSLGLKLLSSQVYDDARKEGESWPHIMLENSYFLAASENPGALYVNNMDHLRLQISQQLSFYEDHMGESADPSLHACSFYMYIYMKGLNSSGRVEQLWFGIPMFDNRYTYCPEYGAKDTGKEDATGLFIYNVPGKDITTVTWHDEETGVPVGSTDNAWMDVDIDLIPYIERALTLAQAQGYMKGVKMESVYVDGMNLGWEMPGTYDAEMIIKNLSLKSYVNTDYETTSGTHSFYVSSMEDVETVAVDEALRFELAKDMIEMDGFDTSVMMLRAVKNTDNLAGLKPETGKLVALYENGLTVNGENYEFTLDQDMTVTYTPSAELLAEAGSADNLKFYTVSKKGVMTALEGEYANGTFTFTLGKMASIAVVNAKPEDVVPGDGDDDKDNSVDTDKDDNTDKDDDKTDSDAPATGETFPMAALALVLLSGAVLCVISKKKRAA